MSADSGITTLNMLSSHLEMLEIVAVEIAHFLGAVFGGHAQMDEVLQRRT